MAASNVRDFIERWSASGAAERASYQLFLTELCDVIGVEHPRPATEFPHENSYVFEKRIPSAHGTANFIDLYKRDCFVLEAKQGSAEAEDGEAPFSEAAPSRAVACKPLLGGSACNRLTRTCVDHTHIWVFSAIHVNPNIRVLE